MLNRRWLPPTATLFAGLLLGLVGTVVALKLGGIGLQSLPGLWELLGGLAILLILLAIPITYIGLMLTGAVQAMRPNQDAEATSFRFSEGDGGIRRVLVSAGAGPHALLGLRLAARLQGNGDGNLTLLRVVPPAPEVDLTHEMESLHNLATELLGPEHGVQALVTSHFSVADAILEESARGYDLLIIGASEERGPRRWLSHTVPDVILKRAPCSVLVVYRQTHADQP